MAERANSSHSSSRSTVPGRRDLMGWRAFASAPAPMGISAEDLTVALADDAVKLMPELGPVAACTLRDDGWHVELCFSFIAHHQTAEMLALRHAAPVFSVFGLPVTRLELETCEP